MEHQTIHALFEDMAVRHCNRIAIEEHNRTLTYEELNLRANQLAHLLTALGADREVVIKTFMHSSANLVTAVLSILKSGGVFLPISKAFPQRRLVQISEQFPGGILITDNHLAETVKVVVGELGLSISYVIILNEDGNFTVWQPVLPEWQQLHWSNMSFPGRNPVHITQPDDGCYIHYTSGTTGHGKAILGRHKSLHHFIEWEITEFGVTHDFRVSQLSQVAFDPYLRDIFVPLCAGGTLCIPDVEARENMALLPNWLDKSRITLMHIVPTVFRLLTRELQQYERPSELFADLRFILLAGEILYAKDLINWRQLNQNQVEFVNLYGPSETTLAKAFHRIKEIPSNPSQIIHVGKPISNTGIAIFNNQHPCNIGEIGEVYIKTPFISKGYMFDPELNSRMFVQNPLVKDREDIIYRTGDLGRLLGDRNIEIVGRADNQVKINGIRVELNGIEQAVLRHDKVKETAVVVYHQESQQDELICYYTGTVSPDELRTFLRKELSRSITPAYFMQMEEFPTNINGKVDKKALPKPDSFIGNTEYLPPENEIEQKLETIWKEVLGLKKISRNVSFFKLGGTSTKAIQVVSRIYRHLNIMVKVAEIFTNDTIEKLGKIVAKSMREDYAQIRAVEEQEYYNVSHAQKRLWTIHQLPGKQHIYNLSVSYLLKEQLDATAFEKAWNALLTRHESLRTFFPVIKGEPRQKIMKVEDMKESLIYELLPAERNMPEDEPVLFDLERGPLVRGRLIATGEARHLFTFTIHHIISDGWSMEVLMHDLVSLYNDYKNHGHSLLQPLKLQYRDYTAWHNQLFLNDNADGQYWLKQFEGQIPVLDLPTDNARPPFKSYEGEKYDFAISAAHYDILRKYAESRNVSLYMVLFAAVNALLHRYTGQQDIVIGSPVMGRERDELEDQVGFYVNTLALRTQIDPLNSFDKLLTNVRQTVLQAFEHKMYPFDLLVEKLDTRRDWSRSPLFDVWVVFQNLNYRGMGNLSMDGTEVEACDRQVQVSLHDLSFNFYESDVVEATIVYNTRLFNRDTIIRMADHFQRLLMTAVDNSQLAVAELEYLHPDEYRELDTFNGAAISFPETAQTIFQLFTKEAKQRPAQIAVQDEMHVLTYGQLYEKSSALAAYIRQQNKESRNQVVALLLDRSADIIIAMLGVLGAGSAYLPIHPDDPEERINYILRDAYPFMVITQSRHLSRLAGFTGDVFAMDIQLDMLGSAPANEVYEGNASDIACVIYTSGSTGHPKGSLITHASMINLVCGLHYRYLQQERKLHIAVVASYIFDPFGKQVLLALLYGHSLFIVPDEYKRSGSALWKYYIHNEIALTDGTPGYLQLLLSALPDEANVMPLKYCWIGGAALPALHVAQLYKFFEKKNWKINVLNEYGLTECTVDNTCYLVDIAALPFHATVPVGKPLPNNQIYILDKQLKIVPRGIAGEICIAGAGVGKGYLNKDSLTDEKFVSYRHVDGSEIRLFRTGDTGKWLPDGNLLYIGRSDDQVKIRGYRVEPDEIAACLRNIEGITDACVIAINEADDIALAAYYTSNRELDQVAIRSNLSAFLPGYMIPSHIVWMREFPLTTNGKINKKALPAPDHTVDRQKGGRYLPPRTWLERGLVRIWEEVLSREQIGVNDNFFEIGGHSLKAVQIVSRIFSWQQMKVEVADLFTYSTVGKLAGLMATLQPVQELSLSPVEEQEYYEASHAQKRMWVLHDQFIFNIFGAYIIEGPLDVTLLERALHTLVMRHEILRTTLLQVGGTVKQRVRLMEDCGFNMVFTDLTDVPAADDIIREMIGTERARPFDLVKGPLIRAKVIVLGPLRHLFLLSMHHSIADDRSGDVVANEIFAFYNALSNKENYVPQALNLHYKDYAAWQNRLLNDINNQEHRDYWRNCFHDYTEPPEMLPDFPRTEIRSGNGKVCKFIIDDNIKADLKSIAIQHNTSLFTVLFTLVNTLLYRYTGYHDIITGTTVSNRNRRELEDQIGYYINILPLRTRFGQNERFSGLLEKAGAELLKAYEHQIYPFDQLVEDLRLKRTAARAPLFDVLIQLNNASDINEEARHLGNLKVSTYASGIGEGVLDLMFIFRESASFLELTINYDADLYKEDTIRQMYNDLIVIATDIISDNNRLLNDIEISTSSHAKAIYGDFVKEMREA